MDRVLLGYLFCISLNSNKYPLNLDDDGDGDQCEVFIDLLHFVASQVNEENAEEEIREAFRVFDGDGNGFIDRLSIRILI